MAEPSRDTTQLIRLVHVYMGRGGWGGGVRWSAKWRERKVSLFRSTESSFKDLQQAARTLSQPLLMRHNCGKRPWRVRRCTSSERPGLHSKTDFILPIGKLLNRFDWLEREATGSKWKSFNPSCWKIRSNKLVIKVLNATPLAGLLGEGGRLSPCSWPRT